MSDDETATVAKPLPPDPDDMNEARAGLAYAAIEKFQDDTGTDFEDALTDLLADLMHLADRHGFDFEHELEKARMHYEAETTALHLELEPDVSLGQPAPTEKLSMEAIARNHENAVTLPLPDDAGEDLLNEVYFIASRLERDYFERYGDAEATDEAKAHLDFAHAANTRAHVAFDRLMMMKQQDDVRLSVTLGTNSPAEADVGLDQPEEQKQKMRVSR